MFSLGRHLTTQAGNVAATVSSIGTSGLKVANNVTGGIVGKQLPAQNADAKRPELVPTPVRDLSRPTRILSLDGGGVRGYSALIILQRFMLHLNTYLRTQPGYERDVLPADFFDLIIGTSTGGIMALMLGRLRMSTEDCITAYQALSGKIFGGGMATTVLSGGLLGTGRGLGLGMGVVKGRDIDRYFDMAMSSVFLGEPAMYDSGKLEKHVKRTVKTQAYTWGEEEALIEDPSPNACCTAVVTARQNNAAAPHIMRSYLRTDQPTVDKVKIWEAARATSAAPAFFSPIAIGDLKVVYVDGAVSGNCNPSALAREEAEMMWPGREIGLLLSLGTGSPTEVSLSGQVPSKLLGFIGLSANTIQVHEAAVRQHNQTYELGHSPYVRLSVENTIDKVRMDDCDKMPQIAASTATYLDTEVTRELLSRAVRLGTGQWPVYRRNPNRQNSVGSFSSGFQPAAMPFNYMPQSPQSPQQQFGYPHQPQYAPQSPEQYSVPMNYPQQLTGKPVDSPLQLPQQDIVQ